MLIVGRQVIFTYLERILKSRQCVAQMSSVFLEISLTHPEALVAYMDDLVQLMDGEPVLRLLVSIPRVSDLSLNSSLVWKALKIMLNLAKTYPQRVWPPVRSLCSRVQDPAAGHVALIVGACGRGSSSDNLSEQHALVSECVAALFDLLGRSSAKETILSEVLSLRSSMDPRTLDPFMVRWSRFLSATLTYTIETPCFRCVNRIYCCPTNVMQQLQFSRWWNFVKVGFIESLFSAYSGILLMLTTQGFRWMHWVSAFLASKKK
jgi:hypothetical protein